MERKQRAINKSLSEFCLGLRPKLSNSAVPRFKLGEMYSFPCGREKRKKENRKKKKQLSRKSNRQVSKLCLYYLKVRKIVWKEILFRWKCDSVILQSLEFESNTLMYCNSLPVKQWEMETVISSCNMCVCVSVRVWMQHLETISPSTCIVPCLTYHFEPSGETHRRVSWNTEFKWHIRDLVHYGYSN